MANEIDNKVNSITELLSGSQIDFVKNIDSKLELFNEKIISIEEQKKRITQKITETQNNNSIDHKELMDYIHDSESALESVETVYKNISTLKGIYIDIEKELLIVSQKIGLGVNTSEMTSEIEDLNRKINDVIAFEENAKIDDDKNYLIINAFIEKSLNSDDTADDKIDFENLTIDNLKDNPFLRIYEKKVELPYTKKEVEDFLKTYPNYYKTVQDVISKEYVMHLSLFNKHPILSRFKETYYLCRMKEMMTIMDSFGYAKQYMFQSKLNPYIIAAVKSKKQLEEYVECLNNNKLDDFKYFKIVFEVAPL